MEVSAAYRLAKISIPSRAHGKKRWSRALVRHGADALRAIAKMLGVSSEEIELKPKASLANRAGTPPHAFGMFPVTPRQLRHHMSPLRVGAGWWALQRTVPVSPAAEAQSSTAKVSPPSRIRKKSTFW